jgi:hypothetical protein
MNERLETTWESILQMVQRYVNTNYHSLTFPPKYNLRIAMILTPLDTYVNSQRSWEFPGSFKERNSPAKG